MFKDYPYLIVSMAMLFIVFFVGSVLYLTRKMNAPDTILFIFKAIVGMLCAVFVVDNIVAFRMQLLSEKEDDFILQSMTDIIKITLGAIVGAKYFNKEANS